MLLLPVIPTRGLTFWSADDQKRAKVKLRAAGLHIGIPEALAKVFAPALGKRGQLAHAA